MREADKVTPRQWLSDAALGLAACLVAYGLAMAWLLSFGLCDKALGALS